MADILAILVFISFISCMISLVWLVLKFIGSSDNLMEPLTLRLWDHTDWVVLPVRILLSATAIIFELPGLIFSAIMIVVFYIMIGVSLALKWLISSDKKEATGDLFDHFATNPFCG